MASTGGRPSPGGRGTGTSPWNTAASKKPSKKSSPQCPPSLQEVKKIGHRTRKTPESEICEQLEGLHLDRQSPVEGTGLVYDDRMTESYCLWDDKFPESPSRILAVKEKLAEYGLLDRCVPVSARNASEEEVRLVHSPEFVELMRSTQDMTEEELRSLSDRYDSVFLHPMLFTTSCLATGSVLQLVDKVLRGEIRNGLAVVRPPGHHAHTDQMNGYCMFNHLAIAARYAQRIHGVKRVLIVDWDVHHGQGTQFIFEHDPSVLYFSIHRYENGQFWPHLVDSSSTAVGKERGERYNINVPWNKTGMNDADYITAFLHLLLPVSYEFQPQLVLVAAGFDSVVGDPKGEMSATPACFAHLTHLLMSLAEGRLLLSLEGGYNMRSLAEGVCTSLKILLGDPCPNLHQPFAPCESALDSISSAISIHRKFWRSLQDQHFTLSRELVEKVRTPQESSDALHPKEFGEERVRVILDTVMQEVMREVPAQRTGLVYDEQMMNHYNMWDSGHPEVPQRIARIFQRHKEMGLLERCTRLPHLLATREELQLCHSLPYIKKIEECTRMKQRELHRLGSEYNSIYINNKSYSSACLAVGSTFSVVEAVVKGKVQNGVCIVRPPGHHAEQDAACGFCFFNNVALAARYAQSLQNSSEPRLRVMILDWDVHHGNGTQHIFQEDPSVLYVSIHRYDNGLFFPSSEDAAHDKVGSGLGEGFNVNIPWNGGKMGDVEYLLAFHRIVMPIAYEFNPQLVLVSAGFDAAQGDPLGGCRVSPEGYAHMTHLLMGLAGGKVVLVLEGGYNLTAIAESMSMCTRALLGDPLPFLADLHAPRPSALRTIANVLGVQHRYWHSLRIKAGPPAHSEAAKEASPLRMSHDDSGFQEGASPAPQLTSVSSGEKVVCTQSPPKIDFREPEAKQDNWTLLIPDSGELEQSPSTLTVRDDTSDDSSPREETSIIPSAEESMEDPSSGNTESSENVVELSPQRTVLGEDRTAEHRLDQQLPDERTVVSLYPHKLENKDELVVGGSSVDQTSQNNQVNKGDSLELVIELQVSGKSPEKQLTKLRVESSVEELLRDLTLGDSYKSLDCSASDSQPVGGARKKMYTPLGTKTKGIGGVTSEQLLEAAAGSRTSHQQMDPDTSLDFSGELFTVTPLPWCPHLDSVCELPSSGIDVTQPCAECGTCVENWICLTCYQVLCGRYVSQHMMCHGVSCGHNLVLSFSDLSSWCYSCDAYVHNEVLTPAKQSAYYSKFGEEMPGA
ncbi:histone deacetylase 6 isoform X2 [Pseudophryne corroboree]|uniref:histone deacetylase 6 isoform X2 n=1 Tax=Pseudophryne corroboree TaxID=495146 RepID=UPI003081906E